MVMLIAGTRERRAQTAAQSDGGSGLVDLENSGMTMSSVGWRVRRSINVVAASKAEDRACARSWGQWESWKAGFQVA